MNNFNQKVGIDLLIFSSFFLMYKKDLFYVISSF